MTLNWSCIRSVLLTLSLFGVGAWAMSNSHAQVFPLRPRLVTLTRIEVEPIDDDGRIRAVNFLTSEGEHFTVVGKGTGELLSWLVTQQTGAAVMITLVNP